jgi:hypothetical protein
MRFPGADATFAYRMICLVQVQTRGAGALSWTLLEFNPLSAALAGVKKGRCLLAGAPTFARLILARFRRS